MRQHLDVGRRASVLGELHEAMSPGAGHVAELALERTFAALAFLSKALTR